MSAETPLIHTIRGNLPIADLDYSTRWESEPGCWLKLIETYRFQGEVVRESAHVLALQPLNMTAEQAKLS
jgi:hypothetical protein